LEPTHPLVILLTYHDDERQLYGDALEQAGFCVTRLGDPHEALRVVTAQRPAAVITRILQPGYSMDGIDLTRAIKFTEVTASIRVIIITSRMQHEYREAAEAAGCDEYLLMPVLPNELVTVVKRLTNAE
jgi:CheY-like chemotaxis protein